MTPSESIGHVPVVVSAVPALGTLVRLCRRRPSGHTASGAGAAEDLDQETVYARAMDADAGTVRAAVMAAAGAVEPGTTGTGPAGERGPW